ncbi:hypothetical protein CAOG_05975 [Capsaspora owczarzaki ATCC 30864]|uniref:BHLH domain-containing protein n=1 Tax=Capsaspora owczarzaki (strain ATCC 30864) TaxID=595528 RepID=A0A0D2VVL2_CAPO3|nr:hypothetical protein CAOG_05975 [Capsaspora owczarzaki ATCC 30864]KJE95527.1 hypothetical protein CAOG_005975 [Capsaspora owczarzaki ATCC 30864]|eukprot:XP_004345565.1 hypothetical protein CAOG_05975 [Capsaspora owczarzaki ATCC 30864]
MSRQKPAALQLDSSLATPVRAHPNNHSLPSHIAAPAAAGFVLDAASIGFADQSHSAAHRQRLYGSGLDAAVHAPIAMGTLGAAELSHHNAAAAAAAPVVNLGSTPANHLQPAISTPRDFAIALAHIDAAMAEGMSMTHNPSSESHGTHRSGMGAATTMDQHGSASRQIMMEQEVPPYIGHQLVRRASPQPPSQVYQQPEHAQPMLRRASPQPPSQVHQQPEHAQPMLRRASPQPPTQELLPQPFAPYQPPLLYSPPQQNLHHPTPFQFTQPNEELSTGAGSTTSTLHASSSSVFAGLDIAVLDDASSDRPHSPRPARASLNEVTNTLAEISEEVERKASPFLNPLHPPQQDQQQQQLEQQLVLQQQQHQYLQQQQQQQQQQALQQSLHHTPYQEQPQYQQPQYQEQSQYQQQPPYQQVQSQYPQQMPHQALPLPLVSQDQQHASESLHAYSQTNYLPAQTMSFDSTPSPLLNDLDNASQSGISSTSASSSATALPPSSVLDEEEYGDSDLDGTPFNTVHDRRQLHLISEQRRRKNMKDSFDELTRMVPGCKDRASKLDILLKTIDFLTFLRKQNDLLQAENAGLKDALLQFSQSQQLQEYGQGGEVERVIPELPAVSTIPTTRVPSSSRSSSISSSSSSSSGAPVQRQPAAAKAKSVLRERIRKQQEQRQQQQQEIQNTHQDHVRNVLYSLGL